MSFNKIFLPDLESLTQEYLSIGDESFIKKYSKYDSILGNQDSIKFLENILKNNQKQCTTSEE